ncbi:MAG: ABC transporter substrate-binding protein, partial [Oscillospiraceae bacterium]|nr:ABC transporter substrate-binding protein [Oscillospiraceae bacterium]
AAAPAEQTTVTFGEDAMAANENATVTEKPDGVQPGTEFSYWTNYDVPLYCPWIDNRASALLWQVYDNLVMRYHSDVTDIRPCLAESWDVSEDNTVYTFHIRQDAYFSDGEQVTADAFVYTWDNATKEYQNRYFASVASYEAVDEFTLVVTLLAPSASFINDLVCQPHCGPVSPKALEQYGAEDNRSAVGCGPYIVDSYTPGEGFVLKATPNYYNEVKQPSIETVKMVLIPDENTALLALQNNELDCMNFVSIKVYGTLEAAGWNILRIKDRTNPFWMNPTVNPIFQDAVVREALCHMVNWDDVNELAYDGLFGVHNSYWDGSGEYPYDESYDYDPDLGLQMLADAGYKPEDIKFTMLADPDFTDVETVLTQMFNDLGLVNVGFETLDGATCYGMLKGGTYEVFPCHNGYSLESCLTPFTMGMVEGGAQPVMFLKAANPEAYDEAMEYYNAATVAPTYEEYVANVAQLTRICQENHLSFGGLNTTRFYAVNDTISGVYPSQIGGYVEFCYMYSNVG